MTRACISSLYGARDTAKMMLGSHYQDHVSPMIAMIHTLSRDTGVSEADAAISLAKELAVNVSGASAVTMLAAYVEIVEQARPLPDPQPGGQEG